MEVVKALELLQVILHRGYAYGIATYLSKEYHETKKTKFVSSRYEIHKEFAQY